MTHDQLCPFFYDHTGRELVRQTGNPCTYCKLIANVREDESTKWIEFYNAEIEKQGAQWEASRRQYYRSGSDDGKALALDAAREAVAALRGENENVLPRQFKAQALAAIRALKEKP